MKLNALILLATIIFGFGVTYLLQLPHTRALTPATTEKPGNTAKNLPFFSMKTTDGTTYKSTDFAGKTVLINFWASWCPPCIAEFPRLLELAESYPDNLVLLAVSSDHNADAMNRFLSKLDKKNAAILAQDNVHIIHDHDSAITFDIFQTARLPETIIVSPAQKMVRKLVGIDWTIDDVESFIPVE